jgi:hypothetical protein
MRRSTKVVRSGGKSKILKNKRDQKMEEGIREREIHTEVGR